MESTDRADLAHLIAQLSDEFACLHEGLPYMPMQISADVVPLFDSRGTRVSGGDNTFTLNQWGYVSGDLLQPPAVERPHLSDYIRRELPLTWPSDELSAAHPRRSSIYKRVAQTGLPNYMMARELVPSKLNIQAWELMLAEYPDRVLMDYIKFGFPVGYTSKFVPTSVLTNHGSADRFPTHVADFFSTEMQHGAIAGPLKKNHFIPGQLSAHL